jgi:hypothetical protein
LDDFIVWAENEDELITRLRTVFERLSEKNLKLNPKKCRFGMEEVEYCGHVMNATGVTFSRERVSEVVNFAIPLTRGELKSFLGMTGYMRAHVPHYVERVKPLQELVRSYDKKSRKIAIDWTPELTEAFDGFKESMKNIYLLYHRDETLPLRLYTDASKYGIGGYLCQVYTHEDGRIEEQPLGFISKFLSATECRWSVYEKEAYAIFYSFKKWEHYLRSKHFHLFTDHKNLTFLNNPPSEKVMRWRLSVQEFDFSVAYIKGEENNMADALSRCVPSNAGDLVHKDDNRMNDDTRPTTLMYLAGDISMPDRLLGVDDFWYERIYSDSRTQYDASATIKEDNCGQTRRVGCKWSIPRMT